MPGLSSSQAWPSLKPTMTDKELETKCLAIKTLLLEAEATAKNQGDYRSASFLEVARAYVKGTILGLAQLATP